MDDESLESKATSFQTTLRESAKDLYTRGVAIKLKYIEKLEQAKQHRVDMGIDPPLCLLSFHVRMRANRPEFSWWRSKYRVGHKVRTVHCKHTSVLTYTNDMDRKIVRDAEKQLAQLRKIWSMSLAINRAVDRLLREREQAVVVVASVDKTEPSSNADPDATVVPESISSRSKKAGRSRETILPPELKPGFKD